MCSHAAVDVLPIYRHLHPELERKLDLGVVSDETLLMALRR
jgi:hypothetical protein